MPEFLFDAKTIYWIIEIGIIILVLVFQRPLAKLAIRIFFSRIRSRNLKRYELIRKALLQPVAFLIFSGAAMIAAHFMDLPEKLAGVVNNTLVSLFMVAAIWMLYSAAGMISATLLGSFRERETSVNPTAAHFIASAIQIMIVIIGLLLILTRWVSDITGLVAGLGIGGLAIALAAQDTASNFIGSITIMLDKPFEIGDFIEVDGIAGTVERVGLRSSRVRAVDQSMIYIPNSKMANYNIINGTKRTSRRVAYKIALPRTAAPDVVRAFVAQARAILAGDPDVQETGAMVYFEGFTTHALEIFICYHTLTDYNLMMMTRERINLALLEAATQMDIACVFPQGFAEG